MQAKFKDFDLPLPLPRNISVSIHDDDDNLAVVPVPVPLHTAAPPPAASASSCPIDSGRCGGQGPYRIDSSLFSSASAPYMIAVDDSDDDENETQPSDSQSAAHSISESIVSYRVSCASASDSASEVVPSGVDTLQRFLEMPHLRLAALASSFSSRIAEVTNTNTALKQDNRNIKRKLDRRDCKLALENDSSQVHSEEFAIVRKKPRKEGRSSRLTYQSSLAIGISDLSQTDSTYSTYSTYKY